MRFSYDQPTTPRRHLPAEKIPIAEGPLNTLPSFFASFESILASFSGIPSVIIDTTLIVSFLNASRELSSALFGAMYTRLVFMSGNDFIASETVANIGTDRVSLPNGTSAVLPASGGNTKARTLNGCFTR